MIARLLIVIIRVYQKTLSPDHGPLRIFFPHGACRYTPSCSHYCLEALQRYKIRGLRLCVRRVVSCHPYSEGGYDPVPNVRNKNS